MTVQFALPRFLALFASFLDNFTDYADGTSGVTPRCALHAAAKGAHEQELHACPEEEHISCDMAAQLWLTLA